VRGECRAAGVSGLVFTGIDATESTNIQMESVGLDGRPSLRNGRCSRLCGTDAAVELQTGGTFAGEFERVRTRGLRDLLGGPEQDVVQRPPEGVGDGGFEFLEGDADSDLFSVAGSCESDLAG